MQILKNLLIETIQPIKENNNLEQENNSYNKNYIEEKLDKLREKGILLLKPMNSEKINKIKNIVDETPDVVSFDIEYEGLKQLALRYKPLITEKINIVEVAREGNKAYKNGDYNLCINIYRQLLEIGEPKSWVYSRLGLAYMKKWNIKQAIDYLKVATSLGNQEEAEYDFSELIDSLKGIDVSENKKVKVKMEETDFYNDLNEYYGIDCIDEISNLIESGSSLKDACNDLKLNEEQKQLILLIYVKECYATENYYLGDIYLSKVEKSKNKSKNINCLISEIRTNKKFYKNRMNEENKKLILIR